MHGEVFRALVLYCNMDESRGLGTDLMSKYGGIDGYSHQQLLLFKSPAQFLGANATMKVLNDQDTKWWNKELIEKIFTKAEVGVINKLSVSCSNQKDILIWRGTTTGEFSVCNTSHMEKERQDSIKEDCSTQLKEVRYDG